MRLFANSFWLTSVGSVGLFRATIEVGAFLNRQSLMVNIAYDMRLRLKHHVAALNGTLHSTLSGVKRTSLIRVPMSANDPKRTFARRRSERCRSAPAVAGYQRQPHTRTMKKPRTLLRGDGAGASSGPCRGDLWWRE